MKLSRYIPLALLACLAGIHLASCEIEGSPNGDFDGFWHMERIDTIATQGVLDLSADHKFWAVQNRLIRINSTLFHFERKDGLLTLLLLQTKTEILIPAQKNLLLKIWGL